jgi:hypothetical protein
MPKIATMQGLERFLKQYGAYFIYHNQLKQTSFKALQEVVSQTDGKPVTVLKALCHFSCAPKLERPFANADKNN